MNILNVQKNLLNVKSIAGLGIIIPLAIAAQPINRWITRKSSGKKGAPIYSDFKDRKEDQELTPKQKAELIKAKIYFSRFNDRCCSFINDYGQA